MKTIDELVKMARDRTPVVLGTHRGIVMSDAELKNFIAIIVQECIDSLDEPPIGCHEWTQMLNDVTAMKKRFDLP